MRIMTTTVAALALAGFALAAQATDEKKPTAQQEKMSACNKDAGDKKGDERKAFMQQCLSAGATPSQQEKMKKCNEDAGDKKGDERKAFMQHCLSASATPSQQEKMTKCNVDAGERRATSARSS